MVTRNAFALEHIWMLDEIQTYAFLFDHDGRNLSDRVTKLARTYMKDHRDEFKNFFEEHGSKEEDGGVKRKADGSAGPVSSKSKPEIVQTQKKGRKKKAKQEEEEEECEDDLAWLEA